MGAVVARRTHKAWASWCALRSLFCLRSTLIRHHLRHFQAVVTVIVLGELEGKSGQPKAISVPALVECGRVWVKVDRNRATFDRCRSTSNQDW